MTVANIVAFGAFFALVMGGLIVNSLRNFARQQPAARVRERVFAVAGEIDASQADGNDGAHLERLLDTRRYVINQNALRAVVAGWHERLRAVGAAPWLLYLVAAAAFSAAVLVAAYLPLWPILRALICLAVAVVAARSVYTWLIARFRNRFLAVLPDTIDLIIRAVRAGIPVVQAIVVAGVESEEPVRSTFRTMGDALLVGADLKDVLVQATHYLKIPDFSFFAVCLTLQRETGGNLGDTLENLANIVRTRREIRAKSRALTAEGRIASKMIASVPFAMMVFLYFFNRDYILTLTNTPAGHKVLAFAAVLLVVGLTVINKLANLDTART